MNKGIRKISKKIHLWLALISGWVVFIVCITGALYAFKDEIIAYSEPWRFVVASDKAVILPSEVLDIANQSTGLKQPYAITYGQQNDALMVDYFGNNGMTTIFINPYTGEVIKEVTKSRSDFDFFNFVLRGHRTLWLPTSIGKPIVGWSVVLFVFILLSGFILWIPRKWKYLKNNFKIRKRSKLYSSHITLGGVFCIFLLIVSLTGLTWSFSWFSKLTYKLTGGGELKPYVLPNSATIDQSLKSGSNLDNLYVDLLKKNSLATNFYFALPQDSLAVYRVSIVHKSNSYYHTDNLFFDQYTLSPLEGQGPYAGKYTEASKADKLVRMTLEIHDGRILGIWGKVIAFLSSLSGAILFLTGFIYWIRRKNRRKHTK